ncbi:MAG TPA: GyrI-like domain-containing protein [Steroidobacteraceae bacterium]|jgi:AraC family transcriptional regulator|nr:GyrI-like domain-containing protein [Steroidobacteraceae bacterium]
MRIDITERPAVRVAYLRYTGPYGEPLGRFWRNTVGPWLADNGLVDCPRYGVALDDPAQTAPGKCRYDACVELPPGLSLPDAPERSLAGGRYAITHFKGGGADIGRAWGEFQREALANPENRKDMQRPPFEHYPRGALYDARTGVFACELCLPLESQP